MTMYRILVVGEDWHGSNCTGLASAFRGLGHAVEFISVSHYVPKTDRSLVSRAASRAFAHMGVRTFNRVIASSFETFRPDIVIVYKGTYVKPEILADITGRVWMVNIFPDNSFLAHKFLNAEIFPLFNHIFTTKRFGVDDFHRKLGLQNVSFLPHGFDPKVHRPFTDPRALAPWMSDVSFIGTWSPRKEQILGDLRRSLAPGQLRIWGGLWERRTDRVLDDAVAGHGIVGDLYALAISASKINLGLLSERRSGASDDDQITSRTFHIPAAGGFMLHQRNNEVLEYFDEGREIACFSSSGELVRKVHHYLSRADEREVIAKAGSVRCIAENSLENRARAVLDRFEEFRYPEGPGANTEMSRRAG